MDDSFFKLKGAINLSDKSNYILNWLTASPAQLRSSVSADLDLNKRLEAVLESLHKEKEGTVIPFIKPRMK